MNPVNVSADPVAVASRLRPVLLKVARELRREVHSLGVTGGQVSLLDVIKHHPGLSMRELAERERMSPPALSKYVAKLEQAGLVTRAPVGPDRRRVGLVLHAEGERVLRSVRSKRTAWLATRLRGLSPEEVAAIEAAIEPLANLLEEEQA